MNASTMTAEETAALAEAYYDSHLRALVETEHRGKFPVLNVETKNYEIDRDEVAAIKRAVAKDPDAHRFLFRISAIARLMRWGERSANVARKCHIQPASSD